VTGRKPVREAPEGLAEDPLNPVAFDGASDLAVDRDPEPDLLALLVLARKGVEHEIPGRGRRAVAIHAVELAAARKAPSLRRHQRTCGAVQPRI
jgi:hypothetical protein